MDETKRGIDAPIQCHKCGDTVGPFDLYDGHLHCEDCLPGGAK